MTNRNFHPAPLAMRRNFGGGVVQKPFGDGKYVPGMDVPRDVLLAIPMANLSALEEQGFVKLYPQRHEDVAPPSAIQAAPLSYERKAFYRGSAGYTVVDGVIVAENLTKEEARVMAPGSFKTEN